jgi:uncharacterized NAD-dependent epimerase/dehydratase family protein
MKKSEKYALYLGDSEDILDIKTANGFHYWRKDDCVGEIALPGCKVSTGLSKMTLLQAWNQGARKLLIGITTHGGTLKLEDVPVVVEALSIGYTIISGLHSKLADISDIRNHPSFTVGKIIEMRTGGKNIIGTGKKRTGKRLLTVGTDCCVGKMFTSLSIHRALKQAGISCTFRATGQTGMMIAEDGICVDAIVADFVAGNVEHLSDENLPDHWDIIEGQGSLFHPAYANVSLALLHGSQPDALIVCHEWGRTIIDGTQDYLVPSLQETIDLNLTIARMTNPNAKIIGISMNTRLVEHNEAMQICLETENTFGVPCIDVVRGPIHRILSHIM